MSGLKRTVLLTCAIVALTAGLARPAHADADPRDYEGIGAVPDKTWLFLTYYRHITTSDSSNLTQNLFLARLAWVKKFGKLSLVPIDFVLPVADATVYVPIPNGGGLNGAINGSGLGDLLYIATAVYAIPQNENNATFVGVSEYFTLPTGNYDREKAINIGAHRFAFKSEVYVGQQFAKNFSLELLLNTTSYTTNTSFTAPLPTGAVLGKLDQKPQFALEAHFLADVASYFSLGASYYATANGREHFEVPNSPVVDETAVKQQTIQSLRGTMALRLEKQSLLLLQYQHDIAASEGASIGQFFGVRVSHFFF